MENSKVNVYVPAEARPTVDALKKLNISISHEFLLWICERWQNKDGAKIIALMAENRDIIRFATFITQFKRRCMGMSDFSQVAVIENNILQLERSLNMGYPNNVRAVIKEQITLFKEEKERIKKHYEVKQKWKKTHKQNKNNKTSQKDLNQSKTDMIGTQTPNLEEHYVE